MRTPRLDEEGVRLYLGDAGEVLRDLPTGSVDCVVTSPPYFRLRDYGYDEQIGLEQTPAEFLARLVAVFDEVARVLSPLGVAWVNMGDSYVGGGAGPPSGSSTLRGNGHVGGGPQRGAIDSIARPGGKPKDLLGMPWRLAFALQDAGWWLRRDVVWSKPNPMPESASDRPTTAHEYVFMLTRAPRYWYDAEAVKEPVTGNAHARGNGVNPKAGENSAGSKMNASMSASIAGLVDTRNMRSVWTFPTEPNPDAHFATFPREMVRRCLSASCPEHVCAECGEPRRRIVERQEVGDWRGDPERTDLVHRQRAGLSGADYYAGRVEPRTLVWTDCGHDAYRPGVVLDPFVGSGTTAVVARAMRRHAVGIDGSAEYLDIAKRRLDRERARAWVIPGPAHVIDDGQLSMEGV